MKILIILLTSILASCSFAPFSSTNNGRSLGQGVGNLEFGNISSNYYIRTMYGAGANMDAGFIMEFGDLSTSGFLVKYSFSNNKEGFAWAMEGSFGGAGSSNYTYLGPIFSLKFGKSLEFYTNFRYINLDLGEEDYDLGDSIGGVQYKTYSPSYLYSAFGFNVWFNENFGMNFYITYFMGSDVEVEGTPFGASFISNF